MKKFNEIVGMIETWIGIIMLASIIILVFASAVMRSIRYPIVWSVDLAQLLFVWICMFGADVALKRKAHVGVDLVTKQFPVKLQNIIALATYVLCILFLAFITYYGIYLCNVNYLRQYQTLQISYSYGTAAVPIGSVLMILTIIEQITQLIQNWNTDESANQRLKAKVQMNKPL